MDLPPFDPHVRPSAFLTAAIPGTGGRLKAQPEDFIVEELPLYEPSGQGEHVMLLIEKRGVTTSAAVEAISRHFGVRTDAVGFAGLKDARAVTRQHLTVHVPGKRAEDFPAFRHPAITVHWAELHGNKLRRGHLAGNRFVIRIRDVEPSRVVHAQRAIAMLEKVGVPNRAGEQRFGARATNHLVARAAILGDYRLAMDHLLGPLAEPDPNDRYQEARSLYADKRYDDARQVWPRQFANERRALAALAKGEGPKRAFRAIDPLQRRFFFSAFQSAVFNAVLERRLQAGTFDRLQEGDIAIKHVNGAAFAVDAAAMHDPTLSPRLANLEISPSGPMWSPAMMRPAGETLTVELSALEATGVSEAALVAYAATDDALEGQRRPLRVPLTYPSVEGGVDEHGSYIKCTFELPRGAFATVAMAEVMKPQGTAAEGLDEDEPGEPADSSRR